MTTRPIFEHRHFTWLAHWANKNMEHGQIRLLANDLAATNPKFDKARFLAAADGSPCSRDSARNNEVP